MPTDEQINAFIAAYDGIPAQRHVGHRRVRIKAALSAAEAVKFRETFPSDGNEEARWIEDMENSCPHCGGSGHKDDVSAAEAQEVKPRVKPLEWEGVDVDWWGVTTIAGPYEIRQGRASVRVRWPGHNSYIVFDGSIDDAKAAAQADYEARILGALE